MTETLSSTPSITFDCGRQLLEATRWKTFSESDRENCLSSLSTRGATTIAIYDIPGNGWKMAIEDEEEYFLERDCKDEAEAVSILESVGSVLTDEWIIHNGFTDNWDVPLILKNGSTKYEEGLSDGWDPDEPKYPDNADYMEGWGEGKAEWEEYLKSPYAMYAMRQAPSQYRPKSKPKANKKKRSRQLVKERRKQSQKK